MATNATGPQPQFKFRGEIKPYRGMRDHNQWGGFYVDNSRRSRRPRPLHPGSCPFCNIAFGKQDVEAISAVLFEGEEYLLVPNHNPIVADQVLFFPRPGRHEMEFLDHRIDLNAQDIRVIEKVTTVGFSNLRCDRVADDEPVVRTMSNGSLEDVYSQPWVAYVNAFPGTGRSVTHLHINCVPAHHIPLLKAETAPWLVSQGASKQTVISRFKDTSFYGLVVEGDDCTAVADTLARLHREMNNWEIPYNLIAYPSNLDDLGPRRMRIAVIPRDQEYCEAADQRIAGLEFVTGVLIPGINRIHSMDTIQRDQAFSQATLKDPERLSLERRLRSIFGMPPIGKAVYRVQDERAKPKGGSVDSEEDKLLRPVVLSNAEFRNRKMRSNWCEPQPNKEESFEEMRTKPNVLVKIVRASICQSDRRVLDGNKPFEGEGRFVIGHEAGGYVVDPGPWSAELMAGQKVIILPHLTCGQKDCAFCHSYRQNLCPRMKHLGFGLNGNMAELMCFPYQCILPVSPDFPDDALPLVEPLACVLRAMFRIKDRLSELSSASASSNSSVIPFTIFGAGPMGCLTARAVKRFWPDIRVTMIDPIPERCLSVKQSKIADEIFQAMPKGVKSIIGFVACSNLQASVDAIATTRDGGTVVLFSGINTDDINAKDDAEKHALALELEKIHREELKQWQEDNNRKECGYIGSSGYNFDDSSRSICELLRHYDHYKNVQNVELNGLAATEAKYNIPRKVRRFPKRVKALEALLSPKGVDDEVNGTAIAEMIKVLIRL